ncbi:MAG: hypothetical protein AAF654_10625 [Myxococcota bacterium]
MGLKDIINEPNRRPAVIQDCMNLIDSEVKGKGGLSGVAVKGAYKIVKAIKPGIIREAVDRLLEPFVGKLEPFYDEWKSGGGDHGFDRFLDGRKNEVANALLGVTDERAAKADNATLKKAYKGLRPKAVGHVEHAVPGVGRIIEKHAG